MNGHVSRFRQSEMFWAICVFCLWWQKSPSVFKKLNIIGMSDSSISSQVIICCTLNGSRFQFTVCMGNARGSGTRMTPTFKILVTLIWRKSIGPPSMDLTVYYSTELTHRHFKRDRLSWHVITQHYTENNAHYMAVSSEWGPSASFTFSNANPFE
jgi:hypothetical protein